MEDDDYVLAFDHFYTTNHIQILKSLLPFMNGENPGLLPVLIKYMELKYTISVVNRHPGSYMDGIHACSSPNTKAAETGDISNNIENIYKAIHRYLAPNEDKSFNQLLSAIRTMKNVREMQQMMELIQSLNPDMDLNSAMENFASNFNPNGASGTNTGGMNNSGNANTGNMNPGGMDINEIMEIMKLFGGNNGNQS